ncbi:MAG: uracil-DNA glycosylase family protein [Actinomycetota bacterium]
MSDPITHPAEARQLFEKMTKIEVPPTICRITSPIPGTAFFPGGFGLWCEGRSVVQLPKGGVMVIGNTFGNEEEHRNALARGSEDLDANRTWHNLRRWLAVAGREPWECFFTNAFIGLWPRDSSNSGKVTWSGRGVQALRRHYQERCRDLLADQVRLLRPSAVVALGAQVPKFLAGMDPTLSRWQPWPGFARVDEAGEALVDLTIAGHRTRAVALLHPSAWGIGGTWNAHIRSLAHDQDLLRRALSTGM